MKNKGYRNFMVECLLIWNTHPWKLCILYIVEKLLPLKLALFINSPLESINFTLFGMWTCHNGFMVLKNLIFSKVPNWFWEVSGLILMCCNFDGWFLLGHLTSSSIFLIVSSNSLCSKLRKIIASSMSIFGSSSCFRLLAWPTSTLSY
jgi:hypothetical protein